MREIWRKIVLRRNIQLFKRKTAFRYCATFVLRISMDRTSREIVKYNNQLPRYRSWKFLVPLYVDFLYFSILGNATYRKIKKRKWRVLGFNISRVVRSNPVITSYPLLKLRGIKSNGARGCHANPKNETFPVLVFAFDRSRLHKFTVKTARAGYREIKTRENTGLIWKRIRGAKD